ncbi:MAG: BMC domain-containing protein [Firmicutes bacterium]|jgi:microcompartment protein CcmL/EutN|nr:BMC domain-containing protein [Bacillota bacterium]
MSDKQALAMLEYKSIGQGLECTDRVLKGFPVELLCLRIVCPGKLLTGITGETAAVRGALAQARKGHSTDNLTYIDDFFLGNPAPGLLRALRGTTVVDQPDALGVIETFTASSALMAADMAVKAALVTLVSIHLARGLAGKAHVYLVGSVGAVEAAVESVEAGLEPGHLARKAMIASPGEATWAAVL